MCSEAIRGDIGLDNFRSHRERANLKWWYKLASLPEEIFPKQFLWKLHKGRQRKTWDKVEDDLFVALGVDKSRGINKGGV